MALQELTTAALDALTKTTLLLALAGLAAVLLRRRSAAARHLAWSTALAGALALPLVAAIAPQWTAPVPLPLLKAAEAPAAPAAASAASLAPVSAAAAAQLAARAVTVEKLPPLGPSLGPAAPTAPARGLDPSALLLVAWAAGSLALLAWTARAHLRARRLVRRARPVRDPELLATLADTPGGRRVRLLESSEIDVPLATGLLRPALVLPADFTEWSAERRRVVLLHELAHVERGDCLAQLVGRLAVAAWWFHPLSWLAYARLRREAEQATDDRVLIAGTKPSDYAAHLLAVVRTVTGRGATPAGLSMAGSSVERRLLALLDPSRPRSPLSRAGLLLGAGFVGALVVGLGGLRAEAAPSDAEAPIADAAHATANHRFGEWVSGLADNSGPAQAHEALKRLVGSDQGERAFDTAMKAHRTGGYESSARGFEEAFDLGYRPGLSAYNTACALARLGRSSRALDWLDIAFENGFTRAGLLDTDADLASLRSEPRFERLHAEAKERAASRGAEGRWSRDLNERRLTELRASDSRDGAAWYQAGHDAHRAQDWAGAEEAWRQAAELGHVPATSRYNVACALARQGQERQALDELEQAIALGFDDASLLAKDEDLDALRDRPRFSRLTELLTALELPGPLNDLEHAREHRSEWQAYAARTGEIARRHPDSAFARYRHGIGLLRSQRWDESAAAFREAAAAGWSEGTCLYNVACALAGAGRTDEALDALERALRLNGATGVGLAKDPDLEPLRDEPRFRALVEQHRQPSVLREIRQAVEQQVY